MPAIQQYGIMGDQRGEHPLHKRQAAEQDMVHARGGEPEYDDHGQRRFERVCFETGFVRVVRIALTNYAVPMEVDGSLEGEHKDDKAGGNGHNAAQAVAIAKQSHVGPEMSKFRYRNSPNVELIVQVAEAVKYLNTFREPRRLTWQGFRTPAIHNA